MRDSVGLDVLAGYLPGEAAAAPAVAAASPPGVIALPP